MCTILTKHKKEKGGDNFVCTHYRKDLRDTHENMKPSCHLNLHRFTNLTVISLVIIKSLGILLGYH